MSTSTRPEETNDQNQASTSYVITRYASPAAKRLALRKALKQDPHAPRLERAFKKLISPQQIASEAQKGVFISYTRADELFALDLADALHTSDIHAWLDMVEIQDDRDWHHEVEAAMRQTGIMIAILSPDMLLDSRALNEQKYFQKAGKIVVPVMASICEYNFLNYWLPVVDFSQNFQRGMDMLYRTFNLRPTTS